MLDTIELGSSCDEIALCLVAARVMNEFGDLEITGELRRTFGRLVSIPLGRAERSVERLLPDLLLEAFWSAVMADLIHLGPTLNFQDHFLS